MANAGIAGRLRLHWPFLLVASAFTLYGLIFIYRTSFEIGGERYFSLFDDAMVSMRYAKNLAAGYGLVWNPGGVPVEGYTNPLWVIYMAGWHLLPIPASKISLAIQLSALVFLLANLFVVRKIALAISGGSETVALAATILTAFYLPLNNWSLQGMEVSVLVLLVSIATMMGLDILRTGRFRKALYVLLAVGTLIRLDVVVLCLAFILFLALMDRVNRRRHLTYGPLLLVLAIGLQTAFRLVYYGDPLPNTYYLKLDGFPIVDRILHGFYVYWLFASSMNLVLFLIAFSVLLLRRDKFILLLCWLFLGQSAYSIYVGGDAWESWGGSNRFISIVMPLFMVLLAYSIWSFLMLLVGRSPGPGFADRFTLQTNFLLLLVILTLTAVVRYFGEVLQVAAWLIVLVAWLSLSFILHRRAAAVGVGESRADARNWRLPAKYVFPLLLVLFLVNLNSIFVPYALNEWLLFDPPLHVPDNQQMVLRALAIKQITKPGATVAVVWAGIMPYFADRTAIDLLGKNDRTLAHMQMRLPTGAVAWRDFLPGHMKYDYIYSIGQLQPDIVTQFWPLPTSPTPDPWGVVPAEAKPYIDSGYTHVLFDKWSFYLKKSSQVIQWDQIDNARHNVDSIGSR